MRLLRTPACTSARHTAIAGSAPHHQRTADVAGGRVSHLDKFTERSNRITAIGFNRWLNGHRESLEQITLVTSQEPEFEPPRDVVHKRLRVTSAAGSGSAPSGEFACRREHVGFLRRGNYNGSASFAFAGARTLR